MYYSSTIFSSFYPLFTFSKLKWIVHIQINLMTYIEHIKIKFNYQVPVIVVTRSLV